MRTALALAIALAACRGSRSPNPTADRDVPAVVNDAATAIDAATDATPAIDAATSVSIADDAIASVLARDAGSESVLLIERGGAIVATTPSGRHEQVVAKAPTRRASYDPRTWSIWFLRDGRLIAIDLTRAAIEEIVVVESMPDVEYQIDRGAKLEGEYCPAGCVAIRSDAAPGLAVIVASELKPSAAEAAAIHRARTSDPPRITDAGRAFFAETARRSPIVWPSPRSITHVELSEARWPGPPSTRRKPTCEHDDCGRTFVIDAFARSLMVVGRKCTSAACWGLCVWFDTQEGLYASLRAPGRLRADVAGEPACSPAFDSTGTAYAIGDWISPGPLAVCTASACRLVPGHYLGWVVEGFSTDGVSEDEVLNSQ
jgi:hypothetical protein